MGTEGQQCELSYYVTGLLICSDCVWIEMVAGRSVVISLPSSLSSGSFIV